MKLDKMSDIFAGKVDAVREVEMDYSVSNEFPKSTNNIMNKTNLFGRKVSGLDASILKNKMTPKNNNINSLMKKMNPTNNTFNKVNMNLPKGYFSTNGKTAGLPKAYFGGMNNTKVNTPNMQLPKGYFSTNNKTAGLPKAYFGGMTGGMNMGNNKINVPKTDFSKAYFSGMNMGNNKINVPKTDFPKTYFGGMGNNKVNVKTSTGLPKEYNFNIPKMNGFSQVTKPTNNNYMNFNTSGNNFENMMRGQSVMKTDKLAHKRIGQQRNLDPMGDYDKDRVINMLDCDPFDRKKQGENDEMTEEMEDDSIEEKIGLESTDETPTFIEKLEEVDEQLGQEEPVIQELSDTDMNNMDILEIENPKSKLEIAEEKRKIAEQRYGTKKYNVASSQLRDETSRQIRLANLQTQKAQAVSSIYKTKADVIRADVEGIKAGVAREQARSDLWDAEKKKWGLSGGPGATNVGGITGVGPQVVYKEEFKNIGTKKNPKWEKVRVPTTQTVPTTGTAGVSSMSNLGTTGAGLSLGNLGSTGQGFGMMTSSPNNQSSGFMSMIPGNQPRTQISGEPQAPRQVVPLQQAQEGTNPQEVIISPYSKRAVTYTRGPYRKQQIQPQYQQG